MNPLKTLYTDYNITAQQGEKHRLPYLDFTRGLAVLFMVMIHVVMTYGTPGVTDSAYGYFIDFLGGPPAAPVFMVTMGLFYMLSSKGDDLKTGLMRGFKIYLFSLVFSFLRTDLLTILDYGVEGINPFNPESMIFLWEVDILQFAGIAMMLMALIRHLLKKPIWWLTIAVFIMIISPFTWGITTGVSLIDWVLHYVWGNSDLTYFPQFSWLYYPLVGMVIGVYIRGARAPEDIAPSLLKPGLILLAIGSAITLTNMDYHIGTYYHSGQGGVIWITGFVLTWMWLIFKLTPRIQDSRFYKTVTYWGRSTTAIYVIHWLLVAWFIVLLGYEAYGYLLTTVLMAFFLVLTHFVSKKVKFRF